jgi:hypothetical protein
LWRLTNGMGCGCCVSFASCGHAAAWTWTEMGQQETPALQKLWKAPRSGTLAIGVAFQ